MVTAVCNKPIIYSIIKTWKIYDNRKLFSYTGYPESPGMMLKKSKIGESLIKYKSVKRSSYTTYLFLNGNLIFIFKFK